MGNKNLTAVEWLATQLEKYYGNQNIKDTTAFSRAKEIEKNQIINTFKDAQVFKVMNDETRAEQYYFDKTYR